MGILGTEGYLAIWPGLKEMPPSGPLVADHPDTIIAGSEVILWFDSAVAARGFLNAQAASFNTNTRAFQGQSANLGEEAFAGQTVVSSAMPGVAVIVNFDILLGQAVIQISMSGGHGLNAAASTGNAQSAVSALESACPNA